MEYQVLALFMVALLLATIAGCFVLVFQCQKLYRLVSKNNVHGHIPHATPSASVSGRVQQLQGLKSKARSSAKIHHAELAEEIRTVTRMQIELTSQLGDLQTYLTQIKNVSLPRSDDDTLILDAHDLNYMED